MPPRNHAIKAPTRDQATKALIKICALTNTVEGCLSPSHMHARKHSEFVRRLAKLQEFNVRVRDLLIKVNDSNIVYDTISGEITKFLKDEVEDIRCHLAHKDEAISSLPMFASMGGLWSELMVGIMDDLIESVPDTAFLWSDLHAWVALPTNQFARYRMIVSRMVIRYGRELSIEPLDRTDSLRAHGTGKASLRLLVQFACDLRRSLCVYRKANRISDTVCFAVGVDYGDLTLSSITGTPVPHRNGVWYRAASHMKGADRICSHGANGLAKLNKYAHERGGLIVMSETAGNLLNDRTAQWYDAGVVSKAKVAVL